MKVLSLEQLPGATLSTNQMLALQQSQPVPLRFPPSGQFACFASLSFVPTGSCDTFLRSDWLFWLLRFLRFLFCGTQSRGALKKWKCPVKISRHSRGTENLSVQYTPDPGCSKFG